MSASTRTVQQPLGIGQFGAALAVVAMVLVMAIAVALGSVAAKPDVKPAPGIGAPPAVIDHGWSQAGTSVGNPSTPIDHGSSESSLGTKQFGGQSPDDRGGVITSPGFTGDPGFAPRTNDAGNTGGTNGPRLRAQ